MFIHGFPNLFMQSTAQSALTVNFPYLIEVQARHTAWTVHEALARGVTAFEATEEAEADWVAQVVERVSRSAGFSEGCTPGYDNSEGTADARSRQGTFFFGAPTEYAEILEAWRADGALAGLELR